MANVGGGTPDEVDRLGPMVPADQGDDLGSIGFGPGLLRLAEALFDPITQPCQHHVGSVDLVARAAEVLADRAEVSATTDAIFHEPGGARLVRVGVAGACVDVQLGIERLSDRPGLDAADQAVGEDRFLWAGSHDSCDVRGDMGRGEPGKQLPFTIRRPGILQDGVCRSASGALPSPTRAGPYATSRELS